MWFRGLGVFMGFHRAVLAALASLFMGFIKAFTV